MRAAIIFLILGLGLVSSSAAQAADAGSQYRLQVACWLDFMPPVAKSGALLYALVTVEALQAPFPPDVSISEVWIVLPGGSLQKALRIRPRDSGSTNKIEAVAAFDGAAAEEGGLRVSVSLAGTASEVRLTSDVVIVSRVY